MAESIRKNETLRKSMKEFLIDASKHKNIETKNKNENSKISKPRINHKQTENNIEGIKSQIEK